MLVVKIKSGEPFDKAFRRFKRKVETEGIMRELKKRQFFLTKSQKRKEKRKLAEKRRRKQAQRELKYKRK